MREVILYIAMSLDGYIADKQGKVDWLTGQNPESQEPDSYSSFLQEIDTVIMGWNTYHQIVILFPIIACGERGVNILPESNKSPS